MVYGVRSRGYCLVFCLIHQAELPVGYVHVVLGTPPPRGARTVSMAFVGGGCWGIGGVKALTGSDSYPNFRNVAFAYS